MEVKMSEITLADVVAASYKWSEEGMKYLPVATKTNTALLLIDIQQLATPQYMADTAIAEGLDKDQVHAAVADYKQRFDASLAKAQGVLAAARQNNVPALHVKIQSQTGDGRDRMMGHKLLGWMYTAESKGAQFLEECKPEPGEAVLTKTTSGAFASTGLDRTLRNMGIEVLYIVGYATDECVETTFRNAVDLGYMAMIVSDAMTTYDAAYHQHVINKFTGWGLVVTSDQVIQSLSSLPEGS
nr:HqiA NAHL lactonase [uncultured bacterium]